MAVVTRARVLDASGRDLRSASAELTASVAEGPVAIVEAGHLHGLAAGLKGGEVTIEGDGGDYLGALNDGATIRVTGRAGRYLGDNMTRGTILVDGDAGDGAGAYCYGGTIVIRGNAGHLAGVMNKGATIIVGGDVGDDAGTYMLAGDVVVMGNAGRNLGNYLIRGHIYIAGNWQSLGHNAQLEEMTADDISRLGTLFKRFELDADPAGFEKLGRVSEKPFYK